VISRKRSEVISGEQTFRWR